MCVPFPFEESATLLGSQLSLVKEIFKTGLLAREIVVV
jgi:hypothetical protein